MNHYTPARVDRSVTPRLTAIAFLAVAALCLSGCGTPQLHVTRSALTAAAPSAKALEVFKVGDRVDRPYEIIGVVSASGNRGGVYSKARKLILAEAAALGADALVGYYVDDEKTAPTGDADGWAGALAVRFLPVGAPAPAPSKVVVALPHTILGEAFGTGKKAVKTDAIARKHARMLLAKKGYYAVLTEDKLAPSFPDGLKALSPTARMNYGSAEADGVLAVNLGSRNAFNAVVVAAASQELTTALYSKSADTVTWSNAGKGSSFDLTELGAAWGIGDVFVPSAKTVRSVHAALVQAFETLPDLTQPTTAK